MFPPQLPDQSGKTPVTFSKLMWLLWRGYPGQTVQRLCWLLAAAMATALLEGQVAIASEQAAAIADKTPLRPDPTPIDLNILQPGNQPESGVTATTISQTRLTIPSLWWMKEQYAAQEQFGDKLIENWVAYPSQEGRPSRVDLIVNRQLWSLLDYLQRYSFVHDFGAARDYGYNIRIFDRRANLLAAYTCNFQPTTAPISQLALLPDTQAKSVIPFFAAYVQPSKPTTCDTLLDYGGKSGLRGNSPNPLGARSSKTPDIVQR
jgi:hypothetical protein